jgi:hypothetical protein
MLEMEKIEILPFFGFVPKLDDHPQQVLSKTVITFGL